MVGGVDYTADQADNLKATELRLGLPGCDASDQPSPTSTPKTTNKRSLDDNSNSAGVVAKAQVVGWPPIRSYRKNSIQAMRADEAEDSAGLFVKVSMDGAPYLRKIDLKMYKGYKELRQALEDLFKCFEASKKGSDYAITYEDKDGDLMLVGDVPWEMFTCSCNKLRIIRGSELVRGLGTNHQQKTCKFI